MIGETDIMYNREERIESYLAKSDVLILKLERDALKEMTEQFPEIKQEVI